MGFYMSAGLLASIVGRSRAGMPPRSKSSDSDERLRAEIAVLRREIDRLERHFDEAERQLQQAQKMEAVGELAGGIAHDFKNILTVITATIKIVTEAVADKPDVAAVAKLIGDAAGRGNDLTQRLLSFTRLEPRQTRDTDLNRLVTDTMQLVKPALGERINVTMNLAQDLRFAFIEPTQFTTAVLNLALNARDAMPDGGALTLETYNAEIGDGELCIKLAPGRYAIVTVRDTGVGIPEGIRHRVFEPFFTTKQPGRGSGLGLSMVCNFVRQSNGHVAIESSESHGTTVRMYLPQIS